MVGVPGVIAMTPRQRELARHALGLPNDRDRSYRNRYTAGKGHSEYANWLAMVAGGAAVRTTSQSYGGADLFELTLEGAEAVLQDGETLDPEDFGG
jgi:hypothetical protein